MKSPFKPSFQHFQRDVERCLEAEGACTKNEHGQMVYRGYDAALALIFRQYIDNAAYAPLVAEFRRWNWEWAYGDQLTELTANLRKAGNWPLLKDLWTGVIAKRRTNYNRTLKFRKAQPGAVSDDLVTKTRELLLDSLHRLRSYAVELQQESEVGACLEMTARVEKCLKA